MLYRIYRYSQWDGTQRIFDIDAEDLMDRLADEVLNQGDVMRALREMMRQGLENRDGQQLPGLRDLLERLKDQRRQQMQQYNMDSVVDDIRERLEDIIQTEREGIRQRLDQARYDVSQEHGKTAPSRKACSTSWNSVPSATWTSWTTCPRASAARYGS